MNDTLDGGIETDIMLDLRKSTMKAEEHRTIPFQLRRCRLLFSSGLVTLGNSGIREGRTLSRLLQRFLSFWFKKSETRYFALDIHWAPHTSRKKARCGVGCGEPWDLVPAAKAAHRDIVRVAST